MANIRVYPGAKALSELMADPEAGTVLDKTRALMVAALQPEFPHRDSTF